MKKWLVYNRVGVTGTGWHWLALAGTYGLLALNLRFYQAYRLWMLNCTQN